MKTPQSHAQGMSRVPVLHGRTIWTIWRPIIKRLVREGRMVDPKHRRPDQQRAAA